MRRFVLPLLVATTTAAGMAVAQTAPTAFPDGAAVLASDDLTKALADKVFHVQPASGAPWRLQYNANGYWYINVGTFADSGKWTVKDSTVCGEGARQIKPSCNELRAKDGTLYLKRDSGEVVKLEPR